MKLRDFHKYGTIDITCSKKVTLSQSSNKKAITNDTKFFIFAIPLVRRVRARRNEESSAPSNVNTLTSLRQQCAEKGLPTYGCRKMQPVPASKPTPQMRQDRGQRDKIAVNTADSCPNPMSSVASQANSATNRA